MTKVTIYKNVKNECVGFKVFEHAGFDEAGNDIVCSAISILVINTMNAIEQFTDVKFTQMVNEEDATIEFQVEETTKETTLLLETMVLGLQTLEDNEEYTEYIDLIFEEV
ncbi:MAG: ribosomal-processing cysteine protease Prp [Tyzzerella sp.]|nr:ribosomal-processing cysteine protease Prp [Tyzzerella sp.]